jgi:uncharacterized repeat protein (TIGR03806 family)
MERTSVVAMERSVDIFAKAVSVWLVSIVAVFCACNPADAGDPPLLKTPAGEKHLAAPVNGIAKRPPWTSSRISGSPDPPLPYLVERAFPALTFTQPVDIVHAPGTNRLFVVEQGGKIFSFSNQPTVKKADLLVDVTRLAPQPGLPLVKQTYALAFHPKFEQNGYCYVCGVGDEGEKQGTRIARFKINKTDPPTIDPASQRVIITWLAGGHNGCCLKFGPDGYLYISTGDGTAPAPPDSKRTGQDISDLLSSILRIDVDHADPGQNYRVPKDNPFVSMPGARPEVWAYGLRNPWRMSFDRQTGDLWVGDVGWELWEMLNRVERGGNYGWSVMEGRQPANPSWPRGPTPILPPTIDHPHSEAASITDGATYYGRRIPELAGVHIYGDYVTGKIWGFRWDKGRVAEHRELADTKLKIVGFGEDAAGELYFLDHGGGTVHRMAPNPGKSQAIAFPHRLSETGLFASVADQQPAAGVVRYSINAEPWEDSAAAERFIGLPGDSRITKNSNTWQFPQDAVLAKTLSIEVDASSRRRRRVETQILHNTGSDWRAYCYQWNDAQTDATLLGAEAAERTYEVAGNGHHRRSHHFASRAECLRCHNPWAGPVLGFQIPQLDKPHQYGDRTVRQLDALVQLGLVDSAVAGEKRRPLADPRNPSADLNERARAYLHVNCAHCHRANAGSAVASQMVYDLPLDQTAMIGTRPTQGSFGIHAAEVIAPGDPFRSVLLYRMSKVGPGHMPYIGSQLVDADGLALIQRWIKELPVSLGKTPSTAEKLRSEESIHLEHLRAETPSVKKTAAANQLLATTSGSLRLMRALDERLLSVETTTLVLTQVSATSDPQVRDLFERFLPDDQRVKRLGAVVRPAEILKLAGDPGRGKRVFADSAGVQCKNCHRIGTTGREVGPDLDRIGKKYGPAQLLESILDPSKTIDPKYATYVVETKDGQVRTGLLIKKDANEVLLKDAQGAVVRIPAAAIEGIAAQSRSLMPDSLLRDLSAQQVSDLIAYLGSLR